MFLDSLLLATTQGFSLLMTTHDRLTRVARVNSVIAIRRVFMASYPSAVAQGGASRKLSRKRKQMHSNLHYQLPFGCSSEWRQLQTFAKAKTDAQYTSHLLNLPHCQFYIIHCPLSILNLCSP